MAASTAALLTLLMVPGAWYHSEHLELVRESLQSNFQDHETSHTVVVVDLPTADKINPGNYTKDDDAEHIRGQVTRLVDAGQDVVIFAHSYGGVPTSQALQDLSKASRASKGKKGGVVHLIYVAAFLLAEGNSLGKLFQRGLLVPFWTPFDDHTTYPNDPSQSLFADVEHTEMLFYKSKISSTASIALLGPGPSYTGFCDVNVTYLRTELDMAIPFDTQGIMIEEAEAFCLDHPGTGGKVVSQSINASHSPFLSQPAAIVDLVEEVLNSLGAIELDDASS